MKPGPSLISLTQRLLECPNIFLETPILEFPDNFPKKSIFLLAVFSDLYFYITNEFPNSLELKFLDLTPSKENINLLNIYAITCYLLYIPFFKNQPRLKNPLLKLFKQHLVGYKTIVSSNKFLSDSQRREELVRFVLYHLGYYPLDESEKYAIERLTTLDSVERVKLIEETKKAHLKREKEIMEAIRRREAQEAASRMSGE